MVEGPLEKISRKKVRVAIRKIKQEKATGLSEMTTEMIVAGGRIAEVMLQLCQRVLNVKGISDKWKTCVVVPILMSLYEGAVGVISGLSEEFSVKVGVHQGSVLWPLLFAMVID